MRDLASRLRAIVRQPTSTSRPTSGLDSGTYTEVDPRGRACVVIDHLYAADATHGRRRVESYALDPALPIALFDSRVGATPDWASRAIFFDLETTGLSGGAGTLAFLVGCGWFEPAGFRVRQFLLTTAYAEVEMLDQVGSLLGEASLLVSYNGRTFDAPLMDMRWAFHRKVNPIANLPHFDMLPSARRLWRHQSVEGCGLSALERTIIGFHRVGDVPGFEIPSRYFQFLRSGDRAHIEGVLEHNRHDLMSLAAVTSHALRLARDGPDGCRDGYEQLALGRLYERAGSTTRAEEAYARASNADGREARQQALARLAVLLRRSGRYADSAAAWQRLLAVAGGGLGRRRPLTAIEREATEALAIHHEHRAGDLETAKRYAETMKDACTSQAFAGRDVRPSLSRAAAEAGRRLARIERKMQRPAENARGGSEAAPLLKES